MKKYFPALVALLAVVAVAATLRAPRNSTPFDLVGFSRLPTLVNGRVKPLDTVARTTLLVLQGRQRVATPDGSTLVPAEWLLDVFFRTDLANTYQTFEIVHPEVLALFNLSSRDGARGKRFSAAQLSPGLPELDRQAKLADEVEAAVRTPFQRAVVQLRNNVILYQRLQQSMMPVGMENYFEKLSSLESSAGLRPAQPPSETGAASAPAELTSAFRVMDAYSYLRAVPSDRDMANPEAWSTVVASLAHGAASGHFNPAVLALNRLGRDWRGKQPGAFNLTVRNYRAHLASGIPELLRKCDVETRFNSAQLFYSSTMLYVLAFLFAVFSWLRWPDELGRASFALLSLAFLLSTIGILTRMWLEARPPVTNLYSSSLFVGWGAVGLCLVLEYFYRNAIGSVAGGLIGFATLIIAHHLALGGDTLEMMRAVLDSNFWLTTHVVTIAVGYSATFLAGFLAIIYVLRGVLTRSLDETTAATLDRMIYGVVCFATLFSFVGTILGGIWADQSWGRFWGWDPKENGALLIVIWNSIILHVRWAGMVKTRGLACLAIFGNLVTAWSWFGVNMLGVGLHSYGFVDAAFWSLVAFAVSQLVVILLAGIPAPQWRSFSARRESAPSA